MDRIRGRGNNDIRGQRSQTPRRGLEPRRGQISQYSFDEEDEEEDEDDDQSFNNLFSRGSSRGSYSQFLGPDDDEDEDEDDDDDDDGDDDLGRTPRRNQGNRFGRNR